MKRRLLILAGLLAAALVAYGVSHWLLMRRAPQEHHIAGDPLEWMQQEFRLDDATFAKVKALHTAYAPTCADLCLAIAQANTRVRDLTAQSRSMTPELADAIREAQLRQADCRTAMLRHIYETAALLPPETAPRYLTAVTGRLCEDGICFTELVERKP
jgi:hypothetical protein